MLKKIFKAVTAFTLLVGCYFGYVQVFAIVVRQMTTVRAPRHPTSGSTTIPTRSELDPAAKGSNATWPLEHQDDLNFRYYNAERGY